MDRVERAKNTELVLCPLGSRTYVLLLILITIFIENIISLSGSKRVLPTKRGPTDSDYWTRFSKREDQQQRDKKYLSSAIKGTKYLFH